MSGIFETIDEVTKEKETEKIAEENTEAVKPEEPKSEGIFGVIDDVEKEKSEESTQEDTKEETANVESIVDLNDIKTEENK